MEEYWNTMNPTVKLNDTTAIVTGTIAQPSLSETEYAEWDEGDSLEIRNYGFRIKGTTIKQGIVRTVISPTEIEDQTYNHSQKLGLGRKVTLNETIVSLWHPDGRSESFTFDNQDFKQSNVTFIEGAEPSLTDLDASYFGSVYLDLANMMQNTFDTRPQIFDEFPVENLTFASLDDVWKAQNLTVEYLQKWWGILNEPEYFIDPLLM